MHKARAFFFVCAGLLGIVVGAHTEAQVFHDDFDGSALDPAKWDRAGGGLITVAGGFGTLSAACGEQFPYVTSKDNPFPTNGDFLVRVGFRYPGPQAGGNGFGTPNEFVLGGPGRGFWVWQDFCCGGFRAVCGDQLVTLASPPETNYHVFEWTYLSGTYSLYVDGVLKASSASTFRPTGFFFGHPPFAYCPWTTQEIDFVHIEALGLTATSPATWGRVKLLYR